MSQYQPEDLVKAGAFSVYQQAGIPEDQWETKFASYCQDQIQIQRSQSLVPVIKQALAAKAK